MAAGYDIGASLALSNASSASNASAFEVRGGGTAPASQTWLIIAAAAVLVLVALWRFTRK